MVEQAETRSDSGQITTRLISPRDPDFEQELNQAAAVLREGGLVAFPTETVYGLGAVYDNPEAILKVYAAKGRPQDNPLIVHLVDPADLDQVVAELPDAAKLLWAEFAPGPLTLILKRQQGVPDLVTAGLPSVAVRFPQHPLAIDLIRRVGKPLVAPSANRSGRPSPTRAQHVYHDLAGRIAYVIDGGDCSWGLESTVLDLTSEPYTILRPGAISQDQLEQSLGCKLGIAGNKLLPDQAQVKAPGMKYRHYAPKVPVKILTAETWSNLARAGFSQGGRRAYFIQEKSLEKLARIEPELEYLDPDQPGQLGEAEAYYYSYKTARLAAHQLFAFFRRAEDLAQVIFVEAVEGEDLSPAFLNRLLKAAAEKDRPPSE